VDSLWICFSDFEVWAVFGVDSLRDCVVKLHLRGNFSRGDGRRRLRA
jgi:hypothetical protein